MDNSREGQAKIPAWLTENDNYIPLKDKDTFVNKSILSVFKLLSRIRMQDQNQIATDSIHVILKVLMTFLLIVLVSVTRSFVFVIIVNVYLLVRLSLINANQMMQILKLSFGVTLFTAFIMLPAAITGNTYSYVMLTSKVAANITSIGLLSHLSKWYDLTGALKRFHIPDIFIMVLDITIKYLYLLGEFSLNLLYALKLRSVGKNNKKYHTLGGIAGNMFLQSRELAQEMHQAMECRGFSGEYRVPSKRKLVWQDYCYIVIHLALFCLFIYFARIV